MQSDGLVRIRARNPARAKGAHRQLVPKISPKARFAAAVVGLLFGLTRRVKGRSEGPERLGRPL